MPGVGVQTFGVAPTILAIQGAADISVTAGTTGTVLSIGGNSGTATANNPGSFVPMLWGQIQVTLGATAPSALTITYATTAGTAILTQTIQADILANSAKLVFSFNFIGSASTSAWQAGLTPLIQMTPTGQAITVRANGSGGIFELRPGA